MLVHPFEVSGCGRAPFAFVGVEYRVGPIDLGGGLSVGAPGQPMGTCAHCGTGIAECCVIRDADGKTFIVGNVCVGKTGDARLIDTTKRAVRDAARERKAKRDAARISAAETLLDQDDALRARLAAQPHPKGRIGASLLDYVGWMFSNAGMTGQILAARIVEGT